MTHDGAMIHSGFRKLRRVMHSLVGNLTSALLAAHLVLGCCWHHAHGCEPACHDKETTHQMAAACHADDEHASAQDRSCDCADHDSRPHEGHQCDALDCSAVLTPHAKVSHTLVGPLDGLPVGARSDSAYAHDRCRRASQALVVGPLRPHLVLSVLLI